SLVVRAPDASAQLMELSETEAVGTVDDDGVGARDVDPGLDDGRAEQHVEALLIEVAHDLLELALAHLAVRDANTGFGDETRERFLLAPDGVDVVVQEIHLAAAFELAQQRLPDQARAGW